MDFEGLCHQQLTVPAMADPPDLCLRENRSEMSDSWSDMSDCELNVDLGLSANDYSTSTYRGNDEDDRLTRSLDYNHVNQNNQEEPQSLPSLDQMTRSMGRNSSSVIRDNVASPKKNQPDQGDKIKVKLMSAWNNMRYGWTMKTKTNFKVDSPIWLLGKCYHCSREEKEQRQSGHGKTLATTFDTFKSDFISRFWFTYRKEIPHLPTSVLTSDVGWGCMLRSGQMMLAQALSMHFLGRDWRWFPSQKPSEILYHRQIVKYFGDNLSDTSPFSIHRLVNIGIQTGKLPGDWYGPASVAHVLREATEQAAVIDPLLGQVCIYVAQDCTVYKQDVIDLCTRPISRPGSWSNGCSSHEDTADSSSSPVSSTSRAPSVYQEHQYQNQSDQSSSHPSVSGGQQRFNPFDRDLSNSFSSHYREGHPLDTHWRAVVILIPVRLGGDVLNPIYTPCVQSLLVHDSSVGIIGGKPKHSLYFIGWQDDKLIHLDPHLCQEHVDVTARDFSLSSFHCMSPRKMSFGKMDPSCTFGFYCRTRNDFEKFVRESQQMAAPPKEKGLYPMFVFQEGSGLDVSYSSTSSDRVLRVQHVDRKGRIKKPSKATDDFVFL